MMNVPFVFPFVFLEKKRGKGKGKALGILAAKLGRVVYHVLHKKVAFDEPRFWVS